jgi:teichuronic acid biosynthesis glycosyltransferase TuaC
VKVLFISNLFPDTLEPYRGLDNATLLHHLSSTYEIRVLSPRPTLAFVEWWNHRSARICRPMDTRFKPAYLKSYYVPKIGSLVNHQLFARAIQEPVRAIHREFPFDRILCSWTYPDGCAVAKVAQEMNKPFVMIAQGSDVHSYLRMPTRRRLITAAANVSRGTITRSAELARLLNEAGVSKNKLHPVYNGVDFATFCPADRLEARKELGLPLEGNILLFVGNFYAVKNPSLLIAAHAELCRRFPDQKFHLVMIGGGRLGNQMRGEADAHPSGKFVLLAGRKLAGQVARYMQAADVLCVPSHNEGVPNVILEAFACGLRVVATRVGGIPEVLCHDFLGRLTEKGSVSEMTNALAETLARPLVIERILAHARQFSWERAAAAYVEILQQAR